MAKIRIPPNRTLRQVAAEMAKIGITIDSHQLADGSYRAYVRKDKVAIFIKSITQ